MVCNQTGGIVHWATALGRQGQEDIECYLSDTQYEVHIELGSVLYMDRLWSHVNLAGKEKYVTEEDASLE